MAQSSWGGRKGGWDGGWNSRWKGKSQWVEKKKSLGQVYLAVVCLSSREVLIARKHWRWGGGTSGCFLHGAGQWVFPGGAVEEKDKNIESAAMREFCEETGVNLASFQGEITSIKKGYYSFCIFLTNETNFQLIAKEASFNIERQEVKDFELKEIKVVPVDLLTKFLGTYDPSEKPADYNHEAKDQAIDWYTEMAEEVIGTATPPPPVSQPTPPSPPQPPTPPQPNSSSVPSKDNCC